MDCLSTSSSFFHPSSNPLKSAFMICPASSSIKASTPLRPSASIVAKLQETTAAKYSLRPFAGRKMPLEPPSATTEVMDNTTFDSDVSQKKVLVPIGYGTEEMEAVIVVDVLRRAGADVTVASVEPQLEVEASGGIRLVADTSIASCSTEIFDLIALPGGMPGSIRLRDCQILQKIMSEQVEEKRLYGAICAAPAVTLLPWGLLRKKNSTCHPAFMDKLPSFRAVKANVQVSGELTTSRGPGTAFEFASSLVEQLFGEPEAIEIRDSVLLSTTEYDSRMEEFNKAEWAVGHTPNVLIPVGSSSEPAEVVSIVDILRRAKAHVVVASVEESLQIFSSRGIKTIADQSLGMAADSTYDLIILPGEVAGSAQLSKSKLLKRLLKEQGSAGRIYGAIGSSPVLLQKQGLLMDKKATAHPSVIKKLEGERVDGAKVVIDGKLITSKGLSTVTDFALAIVGKLFGHARARSVAEGLVFEYPRS